MLRHELSPVAQQSVRRACFDSRLYAFQLLAAFSKALNTRGLMINDNELDRTIAELRALLTQLTGVSVEYIDVRSSRIDIVLIVERIESVGPIVTLATAQTWHCVSGALHPAAPLLHKRVQFRCATK